MAVLNPDDPLSVFAATIWADATIKGATYLNGTTKISKGGTRPKGAENPQLVLTFSGAVSKISHCVFGALRLTAFVDANANGTANTALMGKILKRAMDLVVPTTTPDWSRDGVRIFGAHVSQTPQGPFDNPDVEGEFYMTSEVYIPCIALT